MKTYTCNSYYVFAAIFILTVLGILISKHI